ncbi:Phosphate regulon transcriptional regulatory protein PhoB (SphR) [hydrothermal vent metagenome]|uniref:Phosphate regulon transcriptional regulatory protein PhoB (SphR) n=1 Tax=hydrothermal vent metagenome TaxID=652676 RepID=A0A3B0WCL5_9ZZZZ
MNSAKILFIDDDQRICRLVKRYLENNDYLVIFAHDAAQANKLLPDDTIALILLDIMLPDKDGLTLAQEIRNTSNTPIIFLTARGEVDDKVTGLQLGADDYITKPFEEKELIARIQSVLRRTQTLSVNTQNIHKTQANFAGWRLNLLNHSLHSPDDERVEITSTEYSLLLKLLNQPNNTVKREEILYILSDREWSPLDRSADMAISKLRKKIEKNPRKPEIIKTIRNIGYQLTTAVNFSET